MSEDDGRAPDGVDLTDLTACDREPIHLLGGVQPHGVLLATDRDGCVRVASENVGVLLGRDAREVLGVPLGRVLGDEPAGMLLAAPLDGQDEHSGTLLTTVATAASARPLDVWLHAADGLRVLELEPVQRHSSFAFPPYYGDLRRAMHRLQRGRTVTAVCAAVVEEVRRVTGYDRVMVYRFARDGSGEVVAEARRDDWEPYLGLHYPASDIPVQARTLYEQNWIRAIERVEVRPAALLADPALGLERPLDLSRSVLRAVSPVHLQYLRNMGVAASLSVSILRDGRLWGLVACHHGTPAWPPAEFRAACELLGIAVSMQLSGLEQQDDAGHRERVAAVRLRLAEQMGDGEDVLRGLVDGPVSVLDLVDADGASVQVGEQRVLLGRTPPAEDVDDVLSALLAPDTAAGEVVGTDGLAEVDERFALLAPLAAGALGLRLAPGGPDHVLWLRGEALRSVAWAGDPRKAVAPTPDGARLTPRASFSAWVQTVRGHSRPWERVEEEAARLLWRSVSEAMLRRAAHLADLNERLARSNRELDTFAYVAGHDLKEPLRGIAHQAAFVLEDHGDVLDERARQRLEAVQHLAARMDALLDSLMRWSQVDRVALELVTLPLDDVLDDAVEMLAPQLAEAGVEVRRPDRLPVVAGSAVRLHEVLVNLLSNAVKYRRPDGPAWVEVGAVPGPDGEGPDGTVTLFVRDNGIGVPADDTEAIFTIFRRLHPRDQHGGGAGVGLTISRTIVERHGGRMWAEPRPGGGTTFWLTLPGPRT